MLSLHPTGRRGQLFVGVGAQTGGPQTNADGSVALYTRPTPPPGKETDWSPIKAGSHARIRAKRQGRSNISFGKDAPLISLELCDLVLWRVPAQPYSQDWAIQEKSGRRRRTSR